jgi:hypothetical protein
MTAQRYASVLAAACILAPGGPATAGTLEDDWLFQADGAPTVRHVEQELVRARELAARLTRRFPGLDFSKELAALDAIEKEGARPAAADPGAPLTVDFRGAKWIWDRKAGEADGKCYLHKTFTLPAGRPPSRASLVITCDNRWTLHVNGRKAGRCPPSKDAWMHPQVVDVGGQLVAGANAIAVEGINEGKGLAGLILKMKAELAGGRVFELATDASWTSTQHPEDGWDRAGFIPGADWQPVKVVGAYGAQPWGNVSAGESARAADPAATASYLKLRAIKRRIVLKNPLLNFTRILAIDNDLPRAGGAVWRHENLRGSWEHETLHRTGQFVGGTGRLVVIEGLDPDSGVTELVPEGRGFFWRPEVSYDGKRVVFCMKPTDDRAFHLYEIGSGGAGFRQLTFGDYDDLDPMYAPDGKIIFTTTRGNTYVRCLPSTPSPVLARCDADGSNIYVISRNNEPDFLPAMMNDGRVLYTRWEYTDKALWRVQSLWTTNPDGTGTRVFWGNQSVWPDHVTEARSIPGSEKVMFNGVGHHQWFDGCIGIIDPSKGRNYPDGLYKVTQHLRWPESGNGPGDPKLAVKYHRAGNYRAYKTPYPLSEEYFLVSASRGGRGKFRFRLYLMDVHGNMELLHEGGRNLMHAIPMKARPRPRVLPDTVEWPGIGRGHRPAKPGVLYSNNVFEGSRIPKGLVKHLRVIEMDPKTYSTWLKTVQHDGPAVAPHHPETVKRILGTVPVEADGSVSFNLPAGKAVYFQLLDEEYRCVQTMRSFTGVMPGEVRGCVGCHEQQDTAPSAAVRSIAQRRGPATITPPPWGDESVGYRRFVQPVLDRHCGRCHQGDRNPKARKKLDMTFRDGTGVKFRGRAGHRKGDRTPFAEPYLTFVSGRTGWGRNKQKISLAGAFIVEGYGKVDPDSLRTLEPMGVFSYKSRLLENATSGKHNDVRIDAASRRRLTAWIDTNCPYLGKEEIRRMDDPQFAHIETLKLRPRVGTAPEIDRFNIRQDGDSEAVAAEGMRGR